jgi:hypothetical protein
MFNISFIFNMSNYLLQNLWSINNVKKGHDQLIRKQKQKICEKLFLQLFTIENCERQTARVQRSM